MPKSHVNDAIAITGIREVVEKPSSYILFNQYRKKKRSLHEANPRKGKKNLTESKSETLRTPLLWKGKSLATESILETS